ncbi:DUF423 domain-containing protein [Flavobacterium sp. GT3R68]|uniref:DUF423 domain-containing protein n=1 Tax=Flavobacterium sp. GT3R68 TaxID=2594437 RepID=UPI000F89C577|nr:DUF423 domain-containing protein [Flavobacterium sp. GT3R68]RTY91330.1 DUF423 domain-containing protein [Flavobacterium sp. GSN2]TRW93956.1 DUF423 domain-containing protein [Flavobacterium sp. GT3R68]
MNRKIILASTVMGMMAIILGAFGAHKLKEVLSIEELNTFETGVKYQMYHALFLLFLGTVNIISDKARNTILYLTVTGVIFFSGSIYLLATNRLTAFDFRAIGIVTPIGGVLLILAWFVLFMNVIKKKA